jgi:DNA-binding beta-propeller fold protein YncE
MEIKTDQKTAVMNSVKINLCFLFVFAWHFAFAQNTSRLPVYFPNGMVMDSKNNLFVSCNSQQPDIVKIGPDGQATEFMSTALYRKNKSEKWSSVDLFTPAGLAIDEEDNIYIADKGAADILRVSPDGKVIIVAGYKGHVIKDGPLSLASFKNPVFIAIDRNKNIYVTDEGGDERKNTEYGLIRKISAQGEVTTLKDPEGHELHFDAAGMVCDHDGNIFVCDRTGRCIKKITQDGFVSILGGLCGKRKSDPIYKEGDIQTAEFMEPWYITLGKNGEIYFSDIRLNRIIKLTDKKISTVAGNSKIDTQNSNIQGYSEAGYKDGPAKTALFNEPKAILFDKKGNLLIADGMNHCVRKLSTDGLVSTYYK